MKASNVILWIIFIAALIFAGWAIDKNINSTATPGEGPATISTGTGTIPVGDLGTTTPGHYVNSTYAFAINYPIDSQLLVGQSAIQQSAYIPVCDSQNSVTCIAFASGEYPNTNYDGAGVSVNILPDASSAAACALDDTDTAGNTSGTGTTTVINGVGFDTWANGDAAMSHDSSGFDYQTFYNGACYQLTSRINTTVFDVYPAGTIGEFNAADQAQVAAKLLAVIMSFRF